MRCAFPPSVVAAILLSLLIPSVQADDVEEVEPNDTIATATATGLTGLGTATVTNAFVGNGNWTELDVDLFAFEVNEETRLPVRVEVEAIASGSAFDAFLRLLDATGRELVNNDDRAHDDVDAQLGTHLLEAGLYYVGVSTSRNPHYEVANPGSGMPGTTGAYTLIITTEESVSRESPFEPNDDFGTATPMGSESFEIRGEFIGDGANGRSDRDSYQLHLTGPARIDVAVRAADIGSVLDPAVLVKASLPDGICLRNDDAPDGLTDSMLSVGVPDARDVAIMVYGAGNPWYCSWGAPPLPGSVGYYDLSVTVTYFDGEGANEPDDSVTMATLPGVPGGYGSPEWIEGFVGDGPYSLTRGDRDFYYVEVNPSGILTAEVLPAAGSELDPVMAVYDSAGHRLAIGRPQGGPTGQRLIVPVMCTTYDRDDNPDGMYVMVMGAKQRFPNDPLVPARLPYSETRRQEEYAVGDGPGSIGAYELSVRTRPQSCGVEPNDTLSTAIETGIVDEGYHVCSEGILGDAMCYEPENDVDMWSVELTRAPATLKVTVPWCHENDYLDVGIRVFDDAANELARSYEFYFEHIIVEAALDTPGTYYVAVAPSGHYDPLVQCSGWGYPSHPVYDMIITLTQRSQSHDGTRAGDRDGTETMPLFATRMDDASNMIDALDPLTGAITASFAAPEPRFGWSQGLAVGADGLFYVGAGRYPKLYRLDPFNGVVADEYILWQGSGYYSDIAMLAGQLYLLDFFERSIHVIDAAAGQSVRTLRAGPINGITLGGGLAALDGPNRLYVSDAFNSGRIFELSPVGGIVTRELLPTANRPTALAGIAGGAELWVADWLSPTVEVIDREGNNLDSLELANPVGSLAGQAFTGPFADCNNNAMPDDWDVDAGISTDCNGNGIPDECDTADGGSLDCNTNGIPDECEADCNDNGVSDQCDLFDVYSVTSPRLGPLGAGLVRSHRIRAPREAIGNVTLSFTASGDLSNSGEYVDVDINGVHVGSVFQFEGSDCPEVPDSAQIVIPAETYNTAIAGGDAVIRMTASLGVDPDYCGADSFISVDIQYAVVPTSQDCNGNNIPDDCEEDCNDNGVQDACDIADGTSKDVDGNGRPDECEVVFFVDHDAPQGGDGRTWATALDDLQHTLRLAADRTLGVSEVRIAEGTYTPAGPDGRRSATFEMISGVTLRGGYAGYGAPDPDERDPVMYVTVLSGDLNGDDLPDRVNLDENSYHVVTSRGVDATAVLDGFTITRGYANGSSWLDRGGAGIYNEGGDPTLRNCVVVGNYGNHADDYDIEQTNWGIGMYNSNGNPTLVKCLFIGNSAVSRSSYGGGVFNVDSSPTFVHCTFADNFAHSGGGMANTHSDSTLLGCTFNANDALWGGGIHNEGASPTLTNCTFRDNSAWFGGGVYNLGPGPMLTNCVLWSNHDGSGTGESAQIHGGSPTVTFTCIQGLDSYTGNGNIGDDPLLVDPDGPDDISGTDDDDLRLLAGSPCIDAGDDMAVLPDTFDLDGDGDTVERTPLDLGGNLRFTNDCLTDDTGVRDPPDYVNVVDMGAYEYQPNDRDNDGDVDLRDLADFVVCFTGDVGGALASECRNFDADCDGDLDLNEFAALRLSGAYP
jgi:hypothetical protein